eukprot:m.142397 g.142397  ORF g.142397 m.142397 type:complete len:1442 (+) comp30248_c1_seq5:106-4431(+)
MFQGDSNIDRDVVDDKDEDEHDAFDCVADWSESDLDSSESDSDLDSPRHEGDEVFRIWSSSLVGNEQIAPVEQQLPSGTIVIDTSTTTPSSTEPSPPKNTGPKKMEVESSTLLANRLAIRQLLQSDRCKTQFVDDIPILVKTFTSIWKSTKKSNRKSLVDEIFRVATDRTIARRCASFVQHLMGLFYDSKINPETQALPDMMKQLMNDQCAKEMACDLEILGSRSTLNSSTVDKPFSFFGGLFSHHVIGVPTIEYLAVSLLEMCHILSQNIRNRDLDPIILTEGDDQGAMQLEATKQANKIDNELQLKMTAGLVELISNCGTELDFDVTRRIWTKATMWASVAVPDNANTARLEVIQATLQGQGKRARVITTEEWNEWGPASMNPAGHPIGRCPCCKTICFLRRSVTPTSGWLKTIEHMRYVCCSRLINSFKVGAFFCCPVVGCAVKAGSANEWQIVAHLDACQDVDHVDFLNTYTQKHAGHIDVQRRKIHMKHASKKAEAAQDACERALHCRKLYSFAKGNMLTEANEMLAESNINPNMGGEDGYTPLMTAAEAGHSDMVALLLSDSRVLPNYINTYQQTALFLAAQNNHENVVKVLFEVVGGEDLDVQTQSHGRTPFDVANLLGFHDLAETIASLIAASERRVEARQHTLAALCTHISEGDVSAVVATLNRNDFEYNQRDTTEGTTPLMLAATTTNVAVMSELMKFPDWLNQKNNKGETAVYIAAKLGHAQVVAELCKANEVINTQHAWSAAYRQGHVETTEILKQHQLTFTDRDLNNSRNIHYATRNGDVELVGELAGMDHMLLVRGWPWKQSMIPIHVAACYNQPLCAAILAELTPLSALQHTKNSFDRTALEEARYRGHAETAKVIATAINLRKLAAAPSNHSLTHKLSSDRSSNVRGLNLDIDLATTKQAILAMVGELDQRLAAHVDRMKMREKNSQTTAASDKNMGRLLLGDDPRRLTSMPAKPNPLSLFAENLSAHTTDDLDVMVGVDEMVTRNKSAPQPSRRSQFNATEDITDFNVNDCDPFGNTDGYTEHRGLEEDEKNLKDHDILDDDTANFKFKYASDKRHVRKQAEYGSYQDVLSRASTDRLGVKTPLQRQFLNKFKREAANQWANYSDSYVQCYGSAPGLTPISIEPLNLGPHPYKAHRDQMSRIGKTSQRLAWHGTSEGNFASIEEHGLLVPGSGGDGSHRWPNKPVIKVAHGQAHGRGVYTSKTPQLAHSFGNTDLLLVSVLDDSKPQTHEKIGRLNMTHSGKAVKHVGDAMVINKEANVLPMFKLKLGNVDDDVEAQMQATKESRHKKAQTQQVHKSHRQRSKDRSRCRGVDREHKFDVVDERSRIPWSKRDQKTRTVAEKREKRVEEKAARRVERNAAFREAGAYTASERARLRQVQELIKRGHSGFNGSNRRGAANDAEVLKKKVKSKQGGRNRRKPKGQTS